MPLYRFRHLLVAFAAVVMLGRLVAAAASTLGGAIPGPLPIFPLDNWWNLDVSKLHQLDELRSQVGDARVSIQQMVALIGRDADRDAVVEVTKRRFGWSRPVIGNASELVDHYGRLAEQGIERVYTWFCDFAPPETLTEFGEDVIAQL